MTIELKNGNIMVRELVVTDEEKTLDFGIILPKEIIEEDQVAQGTVVQAAVAGYSSGDIVLFHKTLPVNARLKIEGSDKFEEFFFVKEEDVICKTTK